MRLDIVKVHGQNDGGFIMAGKYRKVQVGIKATTTFSNYMHSVHGIN